LGSRLVKLFLTALLSVVTFVLVIRSVVVFDRRLRDLEGVVDRLDRHLTGIENTVRRLQEKQ